MAEQATQQPGAPAKKNIGRGVSYPVINLERAIEKARAFHREERQGSAPVTAAMKHFGYSETSSGGRQTIATLIQFGLLEDEGRSEQRQVKLTDRALTILLAEPHSEDRVTALREAARMPKLYGNILAKWPTDLPSDHTLSFYLQKEFDFNPRTLKDFIEDFRTSIAFPETFAGAKLQAVSEPKVEDRKTDSATVAPEVGDLIQWEASGVLRLESPRRVRAKSEYEGSWWVFVEGSETGIPMEEAVIIERNSSEPQAQKQPPTLPLSAVPTQTVAVGEQQVASGKFGKSMSYRLLVSGGDAGAKELGKIIKLLEAQKAVLDDDDDEDLAG